MFDCLPCSLKDDYWFFCKLGLTIDALDLEELYTIIQTDDEDVLTMVYLHLERWFDLRAWISRKAGGLDYQYCVTCRLAQFTKAFVYCSCIPRQKGF